MHRTSGNRIIVEDVGVLEGTYRDKSLTFSLITPEDADFLTAFMLVSFLSADMLDVSGTAPVEPVFLRPARHEVGSVALLDVATS